MTAPTRLIFLPGASGNTSFWEPVSGLLSHPGERCHVGYPGFGPTAADPAVRSFDDLVDRVVATIDRPSALIAQSIGGVLAVCAALRRPDLVTHLVLTVTSGGVDMAGLGAADWRPGFRQSNPQLPPWLIDFKTDLSPQIQSIVAPTLLLWGDADPLSPVAVGRRLAALLPHAQLHVVRGAGHDLVMASAREVAPIIDAHLNT